ncbi:MAG: hypothetical protein ACRC3F_03860, partial [Billgrantia desiderata]
MEVQHALEQLIGIGAGNLQVAREATDDEVRWTVRFVGDFMRLLDDGTFAKALDSEAFGVALVGAGAASVMSTQTRARQAGSDTLVNIDNAVLESEFGNTVLDARGFSGSVLLQGGSGNDTLYGGDGFTQFVTVAGDNTLHAGSGENDITGGAGRDHLIVSLAAGQQAVTVGGNTFQVDGTVSNYVNVDLLTLVGNDGGNTLDAGGWHGLGEHSSLIELMQRGGASQTDIEAFLAALGGRFDPQALAEMGATAAVLDITLANGQTHSLNVSDARTLGDLLLLLGTVEGLEAEFDAAAGRLRVVDTTSGAGSFTIVANDTAAILTDALGFGMAGGEWLSQALAGTGAVIDARLGGDNILTGSRGDDRFIVVAGEHEIDGGAGTNTLVVEHDADMTLEDDTLTLGELETALTNISLAELLLTGGSGVMLEATAFSGMTQFRVAEGATATVKAKSDDRVTVDLAANSLSGLDDVTVEGGATLVGYWKGDSALDGITRAFTDHIELRADGRLTITGSNLTTDGSDLTLSARHVTINGASVLNTNGGQLHVSAQLPPKVLAPVNSFVDVGLFDLSLNIGDATLTGGSVRIDALLVDPERDWFNQRTGVGIIDKGIDATLNFLQGLSLFGSISTLIANATIDIGADAKITATDGDIVVASEIDITADVSPTKAWGLGVSVSTLITRSNVHVHGQLTASNDIHLSSSVTTTQNVEAAPGGLGGVAGAVAVSVLVSESRVMVWNDAVIDASNDLTVSATTVENNTTKATSAPDKGVV